MLKTKENILNFLILLSSASTLICCALPALLVSLGMGAVVAGLTSTVPGMIWVLIQSFETLALMVVSSVRDFI